MNILLFALACTTGSSTGEDSVTAGRDTGEGSVVDDSGDTAGAGETGETGADTDTGEETGVGADTATETGGETGDTGGDTGGHSSSAPVVTLLSLAEVGDDELAIEFTVEDADGDAEAGGVDVVVGGVSQHLAYTDLASWDGRVGSTGWAIEPCEHGDTWSVELTATDGAGLHGTASSSVTLSGTSFVVTEGGDTFADAVDLGDLSTPVWVCGDVDRAEATEYIAGQDFDWFTVEPGATDHYTVSLTWTEPYADEDLYVTDASTGGVDEAATDHTAAQPEEITHTLNAGTTYYVYVVGWSLPATEYVLRLE